MLSKKKVFDTLCVPQCIFLCFKTLAKCIQALRGLAKISASFAKVLGSQIVTHSILDDPKDSGSLTSWQFLPKAIIIGIVIIASRSSPTMAYPVIGAS